MVFECFLWLEINVTVAPLAGAPNLLMGLILKYLVCLSIFALYKVNGCSLLSPRETNNSKIPSLSTSATAAPVPYPSASKPVSNFISSNFPFYLILNSLFGSAILFIKTSS